MGFIKDWVVLTFAYWKIVFFVGREGVGRGRPKNSKNSKLVFVLLKTNYGPPLSL